MKMFVDHIPLLFLCLGVIIVHGQIQTGFISIDCGAPENFNYVDIDTGISYVSEEAYIGTGVRQNISSEYAYPKNPNLPQPLSDLRSFPQGHKNCCSLKPAAGSGSLNLIRATFMYGDYDKLNELPEFDLYLDVNLWLSVKFKNASDVVTTEIISVASRDTIYICLVNKGLGIPFISALELRPLNTSIYNTESGTMGLLELFNRWDIGATNGSGRYKDDIYDRIWSPYSPSSWELVRTSLPIGNTADGYKVPLEVINTAAKPGNGSDYLELYWTTTDPNSQFYIYMHFAELEQLGRNQSRKFNISWNGSPLIGAFVPRYLLATTISNSRALVGREHRISILKTADSTFPPILNAVEIYIVKKADESLTYSEDVDAITDIRSTYQLNKSWVGDPCGPKNYSWEGLGCNYNDSIPPRIISLNLSSSGLSGEVAPSIAKLSSLQLLDLSNNKLTGSVPEFLKELGSLKLLNLKGNQLSGSVPTALIEKSKAGLLTLTVDYQNLCSSDSCKKKKNIVVPIVASLLSALAIVTALVIIWKFKKKRQSEKDVSNKEGRSLASKKRQFTYSEVVTITNNFQTTIGKGGFGAVYYGEMKDGTQVAVKMLSSSSSQGSKEFRTEAELLMRVHHRNLASFIGYCDDGQSMALLYEYMANGNLKDCLSGKSSQTLSWDMRLRIAIDAAQGLEYLHQGCKPPIIHRDVKTANILLAENLDAKIADFGLSKVFPSDGLSHVSTQVMGTRGYLDPEYYISEKLNEKSDVYSFGIVLLELITGQPAIIKDKDQVHIVEWVSTMLERGEITRLVDPRLQGDFNVNSMWKALEVAMACTTPKSIQRATMSFALIELKECLEVELSHGRTAGPREEIHMGPSHSPEVVSMDIDSMTGPSAR